MPDYGCGLRLTEIKFNPGSCVIGSGKAEAPGCQPVMVVHARGLRSPTRLTSSFDSAGAKGLMARSRLSGAFQNFFDLIALNGSTSGPFAWKFFPTTTSSRDNCGFSVRSKARDASRRTLAELSR